MSFVVAYLFQLSLCCFYFRTYSLMCNFLFDTYFPLSLKTTSNLTCSILLALCVYSGVSVTLWKPHFLIFVFPQKTVFPWQTGLSDIGLKLLVTYQAKGKIACACISFFCLQQFSIQWSLWFRDTENILLENSALIILYWLWRTGDM